MWGVMGHSSSCFSFDRRVRVSTYLSCQQSTMQAGGGGSLMLGGVITLASLISINTILTGDSYVA